MNGRRSPQRYATRSARAALAAIILIGFITPPPVIAGGASRHDTHGDHAATAASPSADGAWQALDPRVQQQFSTAWRAAQDKRAVFAAWFDRVSVRAMLGFLETEDPRCHGDAHDLGKALYASTRNLAQSLMLCGNGCTNACMHGVVAEAFGDRGFDDVVADMDGFCTQGDMAGLHKPGNCAHGIGHALMQVTDDNVAASLDGCARFSVAGMEYYCATGVFMQYRTVLDTAGGVSAAGGDPCELHPRFPAACYRYMLDRIAASERLNGVQLIQLCQTFAAPRRRGCFHGLGAMFSRQVADNHALLPPLCLNGSREDQVMCIEGVMEKLADFDGAQAARVCDTLPDDHRAVCGDAARGGMYRLHKATLPLYR